MRAAIERWIHRVWSGAGLASTLLLPLSWITASVTIYRTRRAQRHPERAYRPGVPVVVIGNILVGGTGKTPIVIALTQALRARGWTPGVISRGYGASLGSQARLSIDGADARTLGDEPALIARQTGAPVAAHPQRAQAIAALLARVPEVDVIISDDGLQHLAMARDLEIIVQDERGIGNGRLLPAGPLREPAGRLKRAAWVVTTLSASVGASVDTPDDAPTAAPRTAHDLTVTLRPTHALRLSTGEQVEWASWQTRHARIPCSAVAAIGQPERFFTMLRTAGISLAQVRALPDHDAFRNKPFAGLPEAPILITPKDAIKCEGMRDARLWAVHAEPVFSDPHWFEQVDARLRDIQGALGHSDCDPDQATMVANHIKH